MELLNAGLYLVGSVFVIIFALSYFNAPPGFRPNDKGVEAILKIDPEIKPALPKYATERSQYYLYSTIFVAITLLLYFFVSFIFPYAIVGMEFGKAELTTSAVIVFGTLMFIGMSPKIPVVKSLLESYKQNLYSKAQIPDKGMAVFRYLMYGELDRQSESFRINLKTMLSDECNFNFRDSLDEDYFSYDKDRIERKWSRLIYLVCCLEQWAKQEPFKRHIDSGALCWQQIRALCVEKLLPEMVKYKQGHLNSDKEKDELKTTLSQTLIKVYWLITLLLFMSNRGGECPDVHLKNIGWVVNPESYFKFTMKQVFFTGTVVLISILMGAFTGGMLLYAAQARGIIPGAINITPQELFTWVAFGIPMFVMPLLSTLHFKRYLSVHKTWEVYRPQQPKVPFSQRRWDIYFWVAIASYLFTLAVLISITWILPLPDGSNVADVIKPLAMYTMVSAVTSVYISYLLDTPALGWKNGYMFYLRNLIPAIIQGGANVVIISFCVVYFSDANSFDIRELDSSNMSKLLVYAVTVFLIGIAINMTTRIVLNHNDPRRVKRDLESGDWLTVTAGNISRRAEAVKESSNSIEIVADGDLKAVADIGDKIKFVKANKIPKSGIVSALKGSNLTISYGG